MAKEELEVNPLCPFSLPWIKSDSAHQSSECHLLGRGWFCLDLNSQMESLPALKSFFLVGSTTALGTTSNEKRREHRQNELDYFPAEQWFFQGGFKVGDVALLKRFCLVWTVF